MDFALFRPGAAAGLAATAYYVVATLLIYVTLKRVNRDISLLAAFFGLGGCAGAAFSFVSRIASLAILGDSPYLIAFTMEQRRAVADTFCRLQVQSSNIGFALLGLHCLLVGYLILRAGQRGGSEHPSSHRRGTVR